MADRATRIREVLDRLIGERWGAALVSRDGIPVSYRTAKSVSLDSFGAMTAALLGAADGALQEFSADRPLQAVVAGREARLELRALDSDFFLAVIEPAGRRGPAPAMELDAAVKKLQDILAENVIFLEEKR
jgi:predicted regulator of Ras-like GTPase activity (Roadblock/LC7/MglB family)